MAVKTTVVRTATVPGDRRRTVSNVTCSEKYVEGGEKVTIAELGLTRVEPGGVTCNIKNPTEAEETAIAGAFYDPEKELLHLWAAKTGKELVKEKDASKVVVQITATGV